MHLRPGQQSSICQISAAFRLRRLSILPLEWRHREASPPKCCRNLAFWWMLYRCHGPSSGARQTKSLGTTDVPHLNQKAWNNLEKYCRSLTKYNQNVYVCTGPLFLPRMEADGKMYIKYQVIGKNNVAVPTHFFKVLILEKLNGEIELRSYVMPNSPVEESIPLEHFLVPIESIERASGLLFVPNILKRTNRLQAITAGRNS